MQSSLPYIWGQLSYFKKNLRQLEEAVSSMAKKNGGKKTLYGSLPKTDLSFTDFKNLRKALSSSWEHEWK